jgi:hypothetical protein
MKCRNLLILDSHDGANEDRATFPRPRPAEEEALGTIPVKSLPAPYRTAAGRLQTDRSLNPEASEVRSWKRWVGHPLTTRSQPAIVAR